MTPPRHAFRLLKGHFLPLAPDTILGTNFSVATKSNDRGQVVGSYNDSEGFPHGFLLDKKGKLITLDFPTASDTVCYGINESGTVVGYWDLLDANGNLVATNGFVWKDGDFSELRYPDGSFTIAAGVNATGTIVGSWTNDINFIVSHGFVWSKGEFISFDVPVAGAVSTAGTDINAHGQIVGFYLDAEYEAHGFVLEGKTFRTIDYPDASGTYAFGINSAGQIVGIYFDSSGVQHGFLAEPNRK